MMWEKIWDEEVVIRVLHDVLGSDTTLEAFVKLLKYDFTYFLPRLIKYLITKIIK